MGAAHIVRLEANRMKAVEMSGDNRVELFLRLLTVVILRVLVGTL
jgi:hypothetical protein